MQHSDGFKMVVNCVGGYISINTFRKSKLESQRTHYQVHKQPKITYPLSSEWLTFKKKKKKNAEWLYNWSSHYCYLETQSQGANPYNGRPKSEKE